MPSTQRAGIPYPAATDAPTAAADMQAMAESLDPNVVLRATDAADRDAKYLSPVPGMLVTGDDGTVWVADQLGDWHTVYEPLPPWVNLTFASGVTSGDGGARKTSDGHVTLRGLLSSTGGGLEHATVLAWVPAGFEPVVGGSRFFAAAVSLQGARDIAVAQLQVQQDGGIYLSDQIIQGGDLTPFVSLDSVQYWVA